MAFVLQTIQERSVACTDKPTAAAWPTEFRSDITAGHEEREQ